MRLAKDGNRSNAPLTAAVPQVMDKPATPPVPLLREVVPSKIGRVEVSLPDPLPQFRTPTATIGGRFCSLNGIAGNFCSCQNVPMAETGADPTDLDGLEARFRLWRAQHQTPDTVVAAHRAVILERVAQSMTFEGEPITVTRLKTLLGRQNDE